MQPTVLLFDIDGTLINAGGAGRRSMERAFERVTGRADACSHFTFDGMTDRAIVRAGLRAIDRPSDEPHIDEVIDAYLAALAVEIVESPGYTTHPGVHEVLVHCERSGCAMGLGTGNVREGARIKLGRSGLFDRFAFGGFGCDHEDRAELIRVGAERGAERLGCAPGECRVVVIGDTPKDVAAAIAIGAESLAVATGRYDVGALAASGATAVFERLDEPGALAMLFSRG
ncbi:HAD family hydrolase [Polyangium aurulentum]|uniref:HAD family hydrolase n=1 Tax=Polyangium aurulentum TaxID=2567896 RepID=UPI0010ADAC11|nr:HAD family hydrolase [Polyangium aurulentum]UQA59481.1 HAD hydrolase-like protein [Polyangium aurulentum]